MFFEVLLVVVMLQQVGSRAPDDDFGDDFRPNEFIDGLDLFARLFDVMLQLGLAVFLFALGKESLEVGDAEGGILEVLKKGDEVADVVGAVVQRRGADEDDAF